MHEVAPLSELTPLFNSTFDIPQQVASLPAVRITPLIHDNVCGRLKKKNIYKE